MSDKPKKICIVKVNGNEFVGEVTSEYEEIGGPDDGAIFATIKLNNGQIITVKMSDITEE
ncbi:MAG: hypothetical protein EBY39_10645 [Flavobacteriia bacterium]|nr:hypothetical protein [Flavobacteriia bacterium]